MFAYSRIECELELMNEEIERKMHETRNCALDKLRSLFVPNTTYSDSFALTLAYGYFDSYWPAEMIVNQLDLSKLDLIAIQQDFDAFKDEYLIEMERAENF